MGLQIFQIMIPHISLYIYFNLSWAKNVNGFLVMYIYYRTPIKQLVPLIYIFYGISLQHEISCNISSSLSFMTSF
ncbi:hypothetical protein FKM82_010292 [Ascaphus truei]